MKHLGKNTSVSKCNAYRSNVTDSRRRLFLLLEYDSRISKNNHKQAWESILALRSDAYLILVL